MGVIIEITEKKMEKLSDHIEESLRHMGKAMQCVDEWMEEGGMHHHGSYGNRYYEPYMMNNRYSGGRMNYREHDDWDDDDWEDGMMHERRSRRRRDSKGRYM